MTWTPVNDQLPDAEITVLVCGDFDPPVWLGYYDGQDSPTGWRTVEGTPITPTHWMHLPDPVEAAQ